MKLVVRNIAATQLAHVTVTSHDLEHDIARNVAARRTAADFSFSSTFGHQEHRADMAEHVAFQLRSFVALESLPVLRNMVEEALNLVRHFLTSFEVAARKALEDFVEACSDVCEGSVTGTQGEFFDENPVRAVLEFPTRFANILRVLWFLGHAALWNEGESWLCRLTPGISGGARRHPLHAVVRRRFMSAWNTKHG